MSTEEDREYFFNKIPGKMTIGSAFPIRTGQQMRIASEVMDADEGLREGMVGDETVIRRTASGRQEIKAKFIQDSRDVKTLTIQRFNRDRPSDRDYFTFTGGEVDTLLNFFRKIHAAQFADDGKVHITNEKLRDLLLHEGQVRALFRDNEDLFIEVAQSQIFKRDLIALGYRRKQLAYFQRLLEDEGFFEAEQERLHVGPEKLWQGFFQANTWIFGYGLSYQFLGAIDPERLEQIVIGRDLLNPGKRADAVMKSQARINSLCFVEIKTHDTPLLTKDAYRVSAWQPSSQLTGGVAQVQATVQGVVERYTVKLELTDEAGDLTGESVFNIDPRAFLVVGDLKQFMGPNGVNAPRFRSFEVYRRNLRRPEILTFDELLSRARFIVEGEEPTSAPSPMDVDLDDDVLF
jgi:hypothetical protein